MRVSALLLGLLLACTSREEHREAPDGMAGVAGPLRDTMVLRMPDSAEVWYTGSMLDSAADGTTCYERTVEIRRGTSRTPVPLLYTLGQLETVDDTTVRAALVRNCAKYETYLVNTKTAQPRRAE